MYLVPHVWQTWRYCVSCLNMSPPGTRFFYIGDMGKIEFICDECIRIRGYVW